MLAKAHRLERLKRLPLDSKKHVPFSPRVYWDYIRSLKMVVSETRLDFEPRVNLNSFCILARRVNPQQIIKHRRRLLDKVRPGTLIACVLSTSSHIFFSKTQDRRETKFVKVRTFVGRCIRKIFRRGLLSSILVRVTIVGEHFIFRFRPYSPNLLSIYIIRHPQVKIRKASIMYTIDKYKRGQELKNKK